MEFLSYVRWDKTDLDNLHIDTEVTAVYTPYVSALSNKETRENERFRHGGRS